jgi:hypothetical protein
MSAASIFTSAFFRLLPTRPRNENLRDADDFGSPPYAFRRMPPNPPSDPIERQIVVLLWDHPEVAKQVGAIDFEALSADAKRALLADVKGRLGIQPIRRRNLGYVGP